MTSYFGYDTIWIMKEIFLTQGKVTFVDDGYYERLNQYRWFALRNPCGYFYAARMALGKNNNKITIYMHREILGLKPKDKNQADHINHNTLDNRIDNLRICTPQENAMNRKPRSNTTSQFKGVSWHSQMKKWLVHITINKKIKHLGYFHSEIFAAGVYDRAAKESFGEFAHLNFLQ